MDQNNIDNLLNEAAADSAAKPEQPDKLTASTQILEAGRDMSAQSIGRMMGLATVSDIKLFEGKIDLIGTRVSNMAVRMDKVIKTLEGMPTGSDLERIDVQIGALRTLIKEVLVDMAGESATAKADAKKT